MGPQNQAILGYGIIIPQAKLLILLQALRKLTQSPNAEEPIERDNWNYEHYEELEEHLESLLKAEFRFYAIGDCDEWLGLAILYRGSNKLALGCEIEVWGSDSAVRMERLDYKPWNDQELIEAANQAFKKIAELLAELPGINETQIDVEPSWVQGLSLE